MEIRAIVDKPRDATLAQASHCLNNWHSVRIKLEVCIFMRSYDRDLWESKFTASYTTSNGLGRLSEYNKQDISDDWNWIKFNR